MNTDWRSFTFRKAHVLKEMEGLREKGAFRRLSVADVHPEPDPGVLNFFRGVEWLELFALPGLEKIEGFNRLQHLDSLSINYISLNDTSQLKKLKHIKYIEYHGLAKEFDQFHEKVPGINFRRINTGDCR